MDSKKQKDIKGVVKRQRYYASLAKNEGKGALERMKKERKSGKTEMAKDSKNEAKICFMFAKKRKGIAAKALKKLGKNNETKSR